MELDKKLQDWDLFCDEAAELIDAHIQNITVCSQRDFGVYEERFTGKWLSWKVRGGSTRKKYFIAGIVIKNATTTAAKKAISEVRKYYLNNLSDRIKGKHVWKVFGRIFNPLNWPSSEVDEDIRNIILSRLDEVEMGVGSGMYLYKTFEGIYASNGITEYSVVEDGLISKIKRGIMLKKQNPQ